MIIPAGPCPVSRDIQGGGPSDMWGCKLAQYGYKFHKL